MTTRTVRLLTTVALLAIPAGRAASQPVVRGNGFASAVAADTAHRAAEAARPRSTSLGPRPERQAASILLSSIGSIAGAYAGATVGYGDDEDVGGLLVGAAAGTVLGAAIPAGALSGNVVRAALGSVAGSGIALLIANRTDRLWGEGPALVTYAAIHGIITTLVAGS